MVEIHADDFGMFYHQSRRILDSVDEGAVNALSVIVNGDQLQDCIGLLIEKRRDLKTALHINLLDGKSVSKSALLAPRGVFALSFADLLCISYLPFIRSRYKNALKKEIAEQIEIYRRYFDCALRIDSHSHFHMIPVVFDALAEVIEENALEVEYIRLPAERFIPGGPIIRPVNLIKDTILTVLSYRNRVRHLSLLNRMENREFFGILYSGRMSMSVARNILHNAVDDCEILFHPGGCFEPDDLCTISSAADRTFFSNNNRNMELETLKQLRKEIQNVGTCYDH